MVGDEHHGSHSSGRRPSLYGHLDIEYLKDIAAPALNDAVVPRGCDAGEHQPDQDECLGQLPEETDTPADSDQDAGAWA